MPFTENLRRFRLEQFLSQAELARRAGLHALTIMRLEAGTTAPATRTVRALADALNVPPRELATPDETVELRRVRRVRRVRGDQVRARFASWEDDGGAPPPEASGPDS